MDSAVAAAATTASADSIHKRSQRTVFPEAVSKSQEKRPATTRKRVAREYVRSENEQDNENPKTTVAVAIHSFSSLIAAEYVLKGNCLIVLRFYIKYYVTAWEKGSSFSCQNKTVLL